MGFKGFRISSGRIQNVNFKRFRISSGRIQNLNFKRFRISSGRIQNMRFKRFRISSGPDSGIQNSKDSEDFRQKFSKAELDMFEGLTKFKWSFKVVH